MSEPVIRISNFSYAYPDSDEFILKDINLEIVPGECFCLTGDTGSGKSTLVHALSGMLPHGERKGSITSLERSNCEGIGTGTVFQNPETQLLCETVEEEVAFGLENNGEDPGLISGAIDSALRQVELGAKRYSPVASLSMGQKYRLIVASFLAMNPRLLILDEPGAQLDDEGIKGLNEIILKLKHEGYSFFLCEHHPNLFNSVDRYGRIEEGTIAEEKFKSVKSNARLSGNSSSGRDSIQNCEIVCMEGITCEYPESGSVLRDLSFSISRGQKVVITGANGSGKSTLLRTIAGFQKPRRGKVFVKGIIPDPRKMLGIIGYLIQNPQRQLFEDTVFKEVAFTMSRINPGHYSCGEKVMKILEKCGIARLSGCSPFKLSYGQQHLVALASILVSEPEILILDDPFAGFDNKHREIVLDILGTESSSKGTSIIITSHHISDYPEWSDITLKLEDGKLVPE